MKISVLTIFPEVFHGFISTSMMRKATTNNHVEIEVIDFRQYSTDKHQKVDDYPYGGGPGMILTYQPIVSAIKDLKKSDSRVILLAPVGQTLIQKKCRQLAEYSHLILICGHYEGYDERILEHVDEVISIGDYILTGGETAALVVIDSVVRLLEGVLRTGSDLDESFENNLLEYPQYTRPEEVDGYAVPEVLLSGHHQNIDDWRLEQSLKRTLELRPDLLDEANLSEKARLILKSITNDD